MRAILTLNWKNYVTMGIVLSLTGNVGLALGAAYLDRALAAWYKGEFKSK